MGAIAPILACHVALTASPAQANTVRVTQVRVNPTETGIEIILEIAGEDHAVAPEVIVSQEGNTWIADIATAQLPEAAIFEQTDAATGSEFVSVRPLDANRIRVTAVGMTAAPSGELVSREGGLTFQVQGATAQADMPVSPPERPDGSAGSGDPLRIVVTGEAAGSDYFIPTASTATRTETPLLDVPQAIQVIPQQVLEDRQVVELDDALRNVSGVVVDGSEGAGFQFGLRGVQGARLLRDGFSLSASDALSNTGLLTLPEVANIEQIEVLKGPASILYGEIQPGGVINLVTEQPTADPLYEVALQVGSESFFRPQVDLSDRVTPDGRVRYRLNALLQRGNSFRDFDQEINREFVAPVLAWEIGERTDLSLDLEYLSDERPLDSGLLAFGDGVIDVPRDRIAGEPDDVAESSFFSGGYRLEHLFTRSD